MKTQEQLEAMSDRELEIVKSVYLDNGKLFWKVDRGNRFKTGAEAGGINSNGYMGVKICGKTYKSHRVIYFLTHGWMPEIVDHIDLDKLNNSPKNLRAATPSESSMNRSTRRDSISGVKGVKWYAPTRQWVARICANGKRKHLGYFWDAEVAAQVLRIERLRLHGSFSNDE